MISDLVSSLHVVPLARLNQLQFSWDKESFLHSSSNVELVTTVNK